MLSTIIYRSHLADNLPIKELELMAGKANRKNELLDVTGILLFNGTHFFQLLEGPEKSVNAVYEAICADHRHHNLVELMRDYAPARRFGNVGMELFDLRQYNADSVLQAVLDKGTSKYQLTYDDRALQFLRTFVESRERENYFEIPPAHHWKFVIDEDVLIAGDVQPRVNGGCDFAFQPIVDPLAQHTVSLEALVRDEDGGSPAEYFARFSQDEVYTADLQSKKRAFALARDLLKPGQTLAINLLPMSLVVVPGAVDFLLQEIAVNGLVPEQVVVEVTENEIISRIDEFESAVKQLKSAGISFALDDFGAGFGGLSLLARFQPEKIKIDLSIVRNVHKSGPKQAIIQALIKCCSALEIAVIAEGVEQAEEWMWLESAGISHFQGFLFARPALNSVPAVAWPEQKII